MKKAKIAELKNNLSRYLDYVKGGGTVLVLERDRPVAHIVPVAHRPREATDADAHLARLERRGLIRRGTGGAPEWLGRRRVPKLRTSLLKEFLRERESGW